MEATSCRDLRFGGTGRHGTCYWKRTGNPDGALIDNAISKKPQVVQIDPTDKAFKTGLPALAADHDAAPPRVRRPQLQATLGILNGLLGGQMSRHRPIPDGSRRPVQHLFYLAWRPWPVQQIVVVGAGVSGLTSAICLAEAGWPVRVWTAAPPQQTTSRVAGAVWAPPRPSERADRRWVDRTLAAGIPRAGRRPCTGVRMAPALTVGELSGDESMSLAATLIPDLRPAEPADMPDGYRTGFRATMPMIDMPHYLEYLTNDLPRPAARSRYTPCSR